MRKLGKNLKVKKDMFSLSMISNNNVSKRNKQENIFLVNLLLDLLLL